MPAQPHTHAHANVAQHRLLHHKLSHLPLRPSTLSILTRRGFNSTADVQSSRSSGLSTFAAELEMTLTEAAGIGREIEQALRYINDNGHGHGQEGGEGEGEEASCMGTGTAASILSAHYHCQKTSLSRPIITFAQSIDTLLGGGIQPREVTEIAGSPGVGKTQLAMQLCVNVALPREFGGVAGSSIYIDSEGSFSAERCHDMADALVQHVHNSARRSRSSQSARSRSGANTGDGGATTSATKKTVPESFTAERILDSIHVFRVYDETSQTATIVSIPNFLEQMEKSGHPVKLLVVDSIAFHYRCSSADYKSRTKSLANIAASLADTANKYNLAVVVINQMTTKLGGSSIGVGGDDHNHQDYNVNSTEGDESWKLIPALGESWAHATTTRLLLMMDPNPDMNPNPNLSSSGNNSMNAAVVATQRQRRICKLCKSPHKPSGRALFSVTQFGIRGSFLGTS